MGVRLGKKHSPSGYQGMLSYREALLVGRDGCLLAINGEANPLMAPHNIETYHELCPRFEFIHATECPRLQDIALRWGVGMKQIYKWSREQKWALQRSRYWDRIAERTDSLTAEQVAATRARELTARLEHLNWQRDNLLAKLRQNFVEEISPQGHTTQVMLRPRDLRDIQQAISDIDKDIDKCLGLAEMASRLKREEDSDAPVQMIVMNLAQTNNNFEHGSYQTHALDGHPVPELPEPLDLTPLPDLQQSAAKSETHELCVLPTP